MIAPSCHRCDFPIPLDLAKINFLAAYRQQLKVESDKNIEEPVVQAPDQE